MPGSSFSLYWRTVRHLTCKQIAYRMYYTIRRRIRRLLGFRYRLSREKRGTPLKLVSGIESRTSFFVREKRFSFLNVSCDCAERINWEFFGHGRLWTYNLNYFDFLLQPGMDKDTGITLMYDFIKAMPQSVVGLEPYPVSLRCANWVKFLSLHEVKDPKIDAALYAQFEILLDNLEYHLLGNHLLENGFALLFGAYYFRDERLYAAARKILFVQLTEQVLPDGGHFELSPMYHSIILARLFDSVNIAKHNQWKDDGLLPFLEDKAGRMFGWLLAVSFPNGDIPLFNDSCADGAPPTSKLAEYAKRLMISPKGTVLHESGYRRIDRDSYSIIVDVGPVGPEYMPGHAHSDTFSFELRIKGCPVVVDTGVSTYEVNPRRQEERQTEAHNTVMVGDVQQTEVWGGFRVGRRARVCELTEEKDSIRASHDGYRHTGAVHTRTWQLLPGKVIIRDQVQARNVQPCRSFLHFAPGLEVKVGKDTVTAGPITIKVTGAEDIRLGEYNCATGFNRVAASRRAEFYFKKEMEMCITA